MIDDDELRQMLQAIAPPVDETTAWERTNDRMHRDRRILTARRVAVVAVSIAAGAVAVAALPDGRTRTDAVAPPTTPTSAPSVLGDRWERLDPDVSLVPFAGEPVVVNTHDGVLVWGRTAQAHIDRQGATRRLPLAPIDGRDGAGGAWTGRELVVWGGLSEDDGAAYDLAADAWRRIAPSPLPPGVPIASVWSGDEVLVWGGLPGGPKSGAAYNPTTDTWRAIADAPFGLGRGNAALVAPDTLIVIGSAQGLDLPAGASAQAMRYDASSDAWTVLPEPDLSQNATWMVWTGEELIAWDYLLEARSYRLGDDQWTILPDIPLETRECYPGGGWDAEVGVLVTYCDQVALFDVRSRQWTEQQMPFPVKRNGSERELFGPVHAIEDRGLLVLTAKGTLLFR